MASYGCFSIQNKSKSTSHQPPVTSHGSFIVSFTRHQSPGIQAWIKSLGISYRSPVIQSPAIQAMIKSLGIYLSGHCYGLLVTPSITSTSVRSLCRIISDSNRATVTSTSVRSLCQIISDFTGQQLRVLVSGHCVALLVTPTGQQLRVLVSGHCVELLVTSPGNSYEY